MTMTRCKCGRDFVKGTQICPWCSQKVEDLAPVALKLEPKTKAELLYDFKVKQLNDEYDSINGYGPTCLVLVGLFLCVAIVGIPLVIIGGWMAMNDGTRRNAIIDELKLMELERS